MLFRSIAFGFDDFILTSESPASVVERLKLRIHQLQNQLKTEKIIQEMIGHLAEENPEEKFGYKKIKVSLKKGIENND